jgi:hypothetical protein
MEQMVLLHLPICRKYRPFPQADARTRTGDPFITSEVLYQLSYVGESVVDRTGPPAAPLGARPTALLSRLLPAPVRR